MAMRQTLLLVAILFTSLLWSQTKVSGTVMDEYDEPVAFANVIFKDSNEGTITDETGEVIARGSGAFRYRRMAG